MTRQLEFVSGEKDQGDDRHDCPLPYCILERTVCLGDRRVSDLTPLVGHDRILIAEFVKINGCS